MSSCAAGCLSNLLSLIRNGEIHSVICVLSHLIKEARNEHRCPEHIWSRNIQHLCPFMNNITSLDRRISQTFIHVKTLITTHVLIYKLHGFWLTVYELRKFNLHFLSILQMSQNNGSQTTAQGHRVDPTPIHPISISPSLSLSGGTKLCSFIRLHFECTHKRSLGLSQGFPKNTNGTDI